VVVVLLVLAAAGTAYLVDPDRGAPDTPAAVPPPAGLRLPALTTPQPVAAPAPAGHPDAAAVRRALAPVLRDHDLGRHVVAAVATLGGTPLWATGHTSTPASTMKLLTSTAALDVLGPEHRFRTTVVADGRRGVVLVGGGDPLLSSAPQHDWPYAADVATLARATARALRGEGRRAVRVGYDARLFSGPAVDPQWPAGYVGDAVVSPISALWVDEGRAPSGYGRVADPAAAAADAFAAALRRAGITVTGSPRPRPARPGAAELAAVNSPPLGQVVEHTLLVSDNEAAEVLARQVGLAVSGEGSFRAGARAVLDTLSGLGVPTGDARTYDGSGLSRQDRLDPRTLTAVLELAASPDHPALRPVVTGLPVAGFTGSLADRFLQAPRGRGLVRAKTGTLSGVSGLAGIATDREGTPLVFAVLADRIRLPATLDARAALDDATSALAACRCG
jgi:D-alanyl-D-alanine carboxypeptidase/D-alanyl-D-alanine-endopeptidase (penicillin-binding protein 4)